MSDIKHENRAHALLSPSGASRWMNCTPSARKEEHIQDTPSVYALEGTLAHELAEIELKKYHCFITHEEYQSKIAKIESDEMYAGDMSEEVYKYVSYCIEQYEAYKKQCKFVDISIEDKIDLTEYIEEGFGLNDHIILADTLLEVIDLKYGRGVAVSAVENDQLKLYGLGALWKHSLVHDIKEVKLTIVQPRTNSISSFIISAEDLEKWGEEQVKPKAEMAFKGEGEFNPGTWCKFCKFKPKCRAVFENNLKLVKEDFRDPDEITEEELIEVYKKTEQITSWLNSIEAYIHNKLMNKEVVHGYKLVTGRSNRVFTDTKAVEKILRENKYDETKFMSEPKLLSITAIEKLTGKTEFTNLLSEYVSKTEGKPTIALENDKREDFFKSAEDDFKTEQENLV